MPYTLEYPNSEGYTDRVLINDGITRPFQALVRPDDNLAGVFVAWVVHRRTFVYFDGDDVTVTPMQSAH